MNRKVYLMDLCPSPNHIHPKWGQWSCDQPVKNSGRLVPGIWEEIVNIHTDRQIVNYSKIYQFLVIFPFNP